MTTAELEAKVTELEDVVKALIEKAKVLNLHAEATEEARAMLADIGLDRTFFTDAVAAACQEIKGAAVRRFPLPAGARE